MGVGSKICWHKQGNLQLKNVKGKVLLEHLLYSPKIHKKNVSMALVCLKVVEKYSNGCIYLWHYCSSFHQSICNFGQGNVCIPFLVQLVIISVPAVPTSIFVLLVEGRATAGLKLTNTRHARWIFSDTSIPYGSGTSSPVESRKLRWPGTHVNDLREAYKEPGNFVSTELPIHHVYS